METRRRYDDGAGNDELRREASPGMKVGIPVGAALLYRKRGRTACCAERFRLFARELAITPRDKDQNRKRRQLDRDAEDDRRGN